MKCEPMNPSPPVTSQRIVSLYGDAFAPPCSGESSTSVAELPSRREIEAIEDRRDVRFYRPLSDEELRRDLAITLALRGEARDLELARGQLTRAGSMADCAVSSRSSSRACRTKP